MAGEEELLIQATERCNLLVKVKSTVDGLLASRSTNVWAIYGGLSRLTDDIEKILQHGFQEQQCLFGDQSDYTAFIKGIKILRQASTSASSTLNKSPTEQEPPNRGRAWIEKALLDHSLSLYFQKLVSNIQHLEACYHDYAFLRSPLHFQSLCICLQAIERSDPSLLSEVNQVLLNKSLYIQQWLASNNSQCKQGETSLEQIKLIEKPGATIEKNRLSAEKINIAYSDSGGSEREEFYNMPSQVTGNNNVNSNQGSSDNDDISSESEQNGCLSDNNVIDGNNSPPQIASLNFTNLDEMRLARARLTLEGIKVVEPARKRKISQATLAQAALAVVMEKEERSPSPAKWFEGNGFNRTKRSSSLNESDFRNEAILNESGRSSVTDSKASTLPQTRTRGSSCNETTSDRTTPSTSDMIIPSRGNASKSYTDYQAKKALGHNRSKSDQIGVARSKMSIIDVKDEIPKERPRAYSGDILDEKDGSRLSSSLPVNSDYFYYNDPLHSSLEQQSLAAMLASQDLTSCEMDKENAHFSISEALIEAIEQMKCDEIVASDDDNNDDDDDEEIQHLKQEIERRRLERKQEKLRLQPAFSDGTGTRSTGKSSSVSAPSSTSTSSKSSYPESDSSDVEWEAIPRHDEHVPSLAHLSASESTLVSESEISSLGRKFDSIEASTSPLSAEAVAKSLLQKFANKKHPAASELQWLVSEQDVPQRLLPLPQTYAVGPDDVIEVKEETAHAQLKRKTSLPCRMRGNMEWAPPRPQIIFHVHAAPKRKALMEEQNYRCAGCGMRVDPDYMKRFRYCNYLGKYFCSSCHNNTLMAIPARIVRKWDFKKYEVSKFAKDLLDNIYNDPLFNIKDLNPSLYQRVRALGEIRNLRKQLYFFRTFAQTCRKSQELQVEFSKLPDHTFSDANLFSIEDLFQVRNGEMVFLFRSLVTKSYRHIEDCPLCQAKGFICEYCRDGDDIIFPFELHKAVQCTDCRASFHKDCYVKGKCPKCERIRIRKSMIAAPSPAEEETETIQESLQASGDVDLR